VIDEEVSRLEDEFATLVVDPSIVEAITFLHESNILVVVKKWSLSPKNRVDRNEVGHLCASTTPKSMKEDAMHFFEKCLQDDFTKVREISYLIGFT
jgi:hypothetical protein